MHSHELAMPLPTTDTPVNRIHLQTRKATRDVSLSRGAFARFVGPVRTMSSRAAETPFPEPIAAWPIAALAVWAAVVAIAAVEAAVAIAAAQPAIVVAMLETAAGESATAAQIGLGIAVAVAAAGVAASFAIAAEPRPFVVA